MHLKENRQLFYWCGHVGVRRRGGCERGCWQGRFIRGISSGRRCRDAQQLRAGPQQQTTAVDGGSGDDAVAGVVVCQLRELATVFKNCDSPVFGGQKDLAVSSDRGGEVGAGVANAAGAVFKFACLQISRGADATAFDQQQAVFEEEG
jgi:hypothetical protein